MKLAIVLSLLVSATASFAQVVSSPVAYSDAADISTNTSEIKITGARYFEVATKTETRRIPGCVEGGEAWYPGMCDETVVLERTPAIQVDVQFKDHTFTSEGMEYTHMNFNFPVSAFSAEAVAELKAMRGLFGIQKYSASWARKHFDLVVSKAVRTIQIVDVRNSKLCMPHGESGEIPANCVEVLRYKPANITVKALKINLK